MASSILHFKCIVCGLDTASLSNLHKHQSLNHTAEELSLAALSLQSFIYHKHYFRMLESLPSKETCYFYPFCRELFSKPFGFSAMNHKTEAKCQIISKKQEELARPPNTDNPQNTHKFINSAIVQVNEAFPPDKFHSHEMFVNSANSLCNDLMKSQGQRKIKCKRLNGKKELSRKPKRNSEGAIVKPSSKPIINIDVNKSSQISIPDDTEILKIWSSNTCDNCALSRVTAVETPQQIKLKSPTVPIDMINCENALVFNSEIGSFQWNPLSFVEKATGKNIDGPQQSHSPL